MLAAALGAPLASRKTRRGGVAKNPQKQADWQSDLERRRAALDCVAASDADRAMIEHAYQEEIAAGPDFTRRRSRSDFSPPKINADRNELARVLWMFRSIERGMWRADRDSAKREGRRINRTMARTVLPVLESLLYLARKYGSVFPSLQGLAMLARCSRQTVVNALRTLEGLGFVTIQRRCKRIRTLLGTRVVQASNAYLIHPPKGLGAMAARLFTASESKFRSAHKTEQLVSISERKTDPAHIAPSPQSVRDRAGCRAME